LTRARKRELHQRMGLHSKEFANKNAGNQPSPYTQTYSTASKTVPNATASNLPTGGTGATALCEVVEKNDQYVPLVLAQVLQVLIDAKEKGELPIKKSSSRH
jgi:hypothetical protein